MRRMSREWAGKCACEGCILSAGHRGRCKYTKMTEQDYEVEAILDERTNGRAKEYLIKWKGWPKEDSTWEPLMALGDCPVILETWRTSKSAKSKGGSKGGGSNSTNSGSRSAGVDIDSLACPEDALRGKRARGIDYNEAAAFKSQLKDACSQSEARPKKIRKREPDRSGSGKSSKKPRGAHKPTEAEAEAARNMAAIVVAPDALCAKCGGGDDEEGNEMLLCDKKGCKAA